MARTSITEILRDRGEPMEDVRRMTELKLVRKFACDAGRSHPAGSKTHVVSSEAYCHGE